MHTGSIVAHETCRRPLKGLLTETQSEENSNSFWWNNSISWKKWHKQRNIRVQFLSLILSSHSSSNEMDDRGWTWSLTNGRDEKQWGMDGWDGESDPFELETTQRWTHRHFNPHWWRQELHNGYRRRLLFLPRSSSFQDPNLQLATNRNHQEADHGIKILALR